ncbi:MAG: hypothetical protein AABX29_03060 [Nanoarchaeota archaeon]
MPRNEKETQPERIEDVLNRMEFRITIIPATTETLFHLAQAYDLGQGRIVHLISMAAREKGVRAQEEPPYKN